MRKRLTAIGIAVAGFALIAATCGATQGVMQDTAVVTPAASHFTAAGGDGRYAGARLGSTGLLDEVGAFQLIVNSSWDWAGYNGTEVGDTEEVHPCALLNTSPHTFAVNLVPGGEAPWTADATVKIAPASGGAIDGAITGGSICELSSTTNQALVAFTITGGTGAYAGSTGDGAIWSSYDDSIQKFVINEVYLHLTTP